MSATPEQIAERLEALFGGVMSPLHPHDTATCRAAAALIRAQSERVRVLEAKLQKIAGEAPAKEPSDGPTVAWPPNWSDDLQDVVNDMIIDAFADGYARALWEVGQTADAALNATGAPQ